MLLILELQKSCESWVGAQELDATCAHAFHRRRDRTALLLSLQGTATEHVRGTTTLLLPSPDYWYRALMSSACLGAPLYRCSL